MFQFAFLGVTGSTAAAAAAAATGAKEKMSRYAFLGAVADA
jgi:hypothetical protein